MPRWPFTAQILGLKLSTQAISAVIDEDAVDVAAFYAQQPPPPPTSSASLLVIQADGKGVPMVRDTPAAPKVRLGKGDKRSRKKEAIVTGVYTLMPRCAHQPVWSPTCFTPKRRLTQPRPVCRRSLDRKPSGCGRRSMVKMPPSSALCRKQPNMKARISSTASP